MKYFNSHKHYLEFRKAWATTINSDAVKPKYLPTSEWKLRNPNFVGPINLYSSKTMLFSAGTGCIIKRGSVQAVHNVLYNLLCNKQLDKGFNPIINSKKLHVYISPYCTFYNAVDRLMKTVRSAQHIVKDNKKVKELHSMADIIKLRRQRHGHKQVLLPIWIRKSKLQAIERLLVPFTDTVTVEMLANIDDRRLELVLMFDRQHKVNNWLNVS